MPEQCPFCGAPERSRVHCIPVSGGSEYDVVTGQCGTTWSIPEGRVPARDSKVCLCWQIGCLRAGRDWLLRILMRM